MFVPEDASPPGDKVSINTSLTIDSQLIVTGPPFEIDIQDTLPLTQEVGA